MSSFEEIGRVKGLCSIGVGLQVFMEAFGSVDLKSLWSRLVLDEGREKSSDWLFFWNTTTGGSYFRNTSKSNGCFFFNSCINPRARACTRDFTEVYN